MTIPFPRAPGVKQRRKFIWHNRFNGIEKGNPVDTIPAAKAAAVAVYDAIQDGFAFDIAIQDDQGKVVAEGFIRGGVWHDGEFSETDEQRRDRLKGL